MEECPNFLKPRLRLFLSADIVGSTALKQSRFGALSEPSAKDHASWFSVIQGFYIESQQAFLSEWAKLQESPRTRLEYFGEPPTLWKTIGDEVLFVKTLSDFRQLSVAMKCWTRALATMREFVRREDKRLDVKSTAWVAGFPFKNKEVVLGAAADFSQGPVQNYYLESGRLLNEYYENPISSKIIVDYIGPSIDIGFRLASLSSPRRFVVSIDVAYLLSLTMASSDRVVDTIPLFYDGAVQLKGVFGGTRYPVFWADMGDGKLPTLEDKLTGQKASSRDDVISFCEEFYQEFSAYTFRPFIESQTEQQLTTKPPWYSEIHANLVKNFLDSIASEQMSAGATDEQNNDHGTPRMDASELEKSISDLVQELRKAAAQASPKK